MLGSTVASGDDFVNLSVFSAMLGSTVALGDDFEQMFVFSAMLGSTLDLVLPVFVAISQVQLLDKVVVPVVCMANALVKLLITVEVPQLQFLFKVVNIPRRCAETASHGLTSQRP